MITQVVAAPPRVDVGEPVEFRVTAEGGAKPYSYLWQFGDGETSTEAQPSVETAAAVQ